MAHNLASYGGFKGVRFLIHSGRLWFFSMPPSVALTADSELIAYKAGMLARLKVFLKDESGATAIEYGLIAAGISVAIIAVVNGMGTKLKTTFSSLSSQLK